VLYPDGTRGYADYTIFGPKRGWRRPDKENDLTFEGWIFGDLRLTDTDAVFVDDAEQPSPTAPLDWGYPDLEVDLFNSTDVRKLSQDQGFAMALYEALAYAIWRRRRGGQVWCCTDRGAGAIVANLRGRGENYHDYFWRGVPSIARGREKEVSLALDGLGWRPLPLPEFDRLDKALREQLDSWEDRPALLGPQWHVDRREPANRVSSTRVGGLIQRVDALAASGRVSKKEWNQFFRLLHGATR
jgi:hypothetical protein